MCVRKGDFKKGEIEITNENIVFSNRYLTAYNDDVVFPSEVSGTYFRVVPSSTVSVCVLPVADDGDFYFLKTYRHAMRGWCFEVPKGGVEQGEDIEAAALRELLEESGLVADRLVNIGVFAESPAVLDSKLVCFAALGCRKGAEAKPEFSEAIGSVYKFSTEAYHKEKKKLDFADAMTELMLLEYSGQVNADEE